MLQFFRNLTKSKIGAGVILVILGLIAFAFASGDVANTGGFGGVAGGDRVATVGDERVDTSTLTQAATTTLERMKQQNPTLSMSAFVASGGLEEVLDDLIDRLAVAAFGKEHGIVAGDRLVDSEIAKMPAFKGVDGQFSEEVFRQAITQRGISETLIRDDIAQGLIARQVMIPASFGTTVPEELARRYAALLGESRKAEIAVLPSLMFISGKKPTDAELAAYYNANRDKFIRPERRVIRYAMFGEDVLKGVPAPTDAEIAARYNARKAEFQASERRRLVQVIVPTDAAARAVAAEVAKGTSLETAAREKGLAAANLDPLSKADLGRQFSPAVADAVFAAAKGAIATPARSGLGWHVIRVEDIEARPARTLDQVRDELIAQLAIDKRRAALNAMLEKLEEGFDSGANLAETAQSLGLKLETTKPVTADGRVYLARDERAPALLSPVLSTAFMMEQEKPQLAEVERGKTFMLYDVSDIAESAPAPLKDIRNDVQLAYLTDQGSRAAKQAADKVRSEVRKGKSLRDAVAALGKQGAQVQSVAMTRPQLSELQQRSQGQVPRPLAMMFNMAQGTVKVRQAERGLGWFIVSLTKIEPGKIAAGDRIVDVARGELGQIAGREYSDALGRAIKGEVGVKRNEAGIRAVRQQLAGGN
ncbi:MAG TPA: peptidyl-prolyl cis-trans isomerase [Novosphingobium sp.]|nr:peptidyl-prolyl cis-trans isomerase [Novosphingobium sp.]